MSNKTITAQQAREKLLLVWDECEFGVKERVKKAFSRRVVHYILKTEGYSDAGKILEIIDSIKEHCEAVKNETAAMDKKVNKMLKV